MCWVRFLYNIHMCMDIHEKGKTGNKYRLYCKTEPNFPSHIWTNFSVTVFWIRIWNPNVDWILILHQTLGLYKHFYIKYVYKREFGKFAENKLHNLFSFVFFFFEKKTFMSFILCLLEFQYNMLSILDFFLVSI